MALLQSHSFRDTAGKSELNRLLKAAHSSSRSLPVLFWSQVLGTIMVLIATFMPTYAGFTAFRTLQGFFATAPQVIGLSVVSIFLHK